MQLRLCEFNRATNNVPWKRSGHPTTTWRDHKWDDIHANTGASPHRLFSDEQIIKSGFPGMGVQERAFALLWDFENNGSHSSRPLVCLYNDPIIMDLVKDDNDWTLVELTAQTTIQWLGTNCGSCFVDEARKYAKKDKIRLTKIIDPARYELEMKNVDPDTYYERMTKRLQEQHQKELDNLKAKHQRELDKLVKEAMEEERVREEQQLVEKLESSMAAATAPRVLTLE